MSNQVYQIITDQIISQLEAGVVPWHKPWNTSGLMPTNFVSNKEYRGINPFLLESAGFECPYWLTFKQAKLKGGTVRKGEKGSIVIFWKLNEYENEENPEGPARKVPILRYYKVFNLSQCDGLDWDKPAPVNDFKPIEEAERIASGYKGPEVKHGKGRACYHPQLDYIEMPDAERFDCGEEYYSTLFHEMGHSTGNKNRLNRASLTESAYFGSHEYSKEELVAEFTASFLCGVSHIEQATLANSAAYIAGWKRKLKDDAKLIVQAAANAQKAADLIRGIKH